MTKKSQWFFVIGLQVIMPILNWDAKPTMFAYWTPSLVRCIQRHFCAQMGLCFNSKSSTVIGGKWIIANQPGLRHYVAWASY